MTLEVKTGTNWEFTCKVIDQANAPVDVSGGTATCLLKAERDDLDEDALAELDVDLSAGADGSVTMTLAVAETEDIEPGDYWCGLRVKVGSFEDEVVEFGVRVVRAIVRAM